ncbi:MAG: NADH dehydrogenase FAD-containing subunit, partial [Spartobacteria bacterium]|nr:NADH dehydrogenase FAD-containing subunit [Spartobacteria bacterium]
MTLPLILLPAMAGIAAFFIPAPRWSRRLLLTTAVCHPALLVPFWATGLPAANTDWFQLDGIGLLFLSIISLLFLAATVSATVYLPQQASTGGHMRESTFTGCLLFFLATMSFVCLCRDFGLLWIGVEATTLASAPLIFFHRNNRSLEATWKYLLICSVGIALALMGNLFLTVSAQYALCGREASLWIPHLMEIAPRLNGPWLKAAFVFLLIGYGTKMGLAPMHTWLPDAHSEAPSLVSALLSGALLNCAFLGILRAFALCVATGEAAFAKDLLLVLGLLSLLVAAVFILGQTDYKRMLAYS